MTEPTVLFERLPADGPITGNFGDSYTAGGHRGTDIGVPVGTPVYAPASGVTVAPTNDGSFGNAVCLAHPDGWFTLYAHLSVVKVPLGTLVDTGVVLGLSGNTGLSSGPHVHWQLCDSSTFPTDIAHSRNPLNYMEDDPMEKYRLSLMQIAGGDYERLNMSYAKLRGAGFALPAQLDDDLNGAVVRRFAMIELAASARARDAYVALGGSL